MCAALPNKIMVQNYEILDDNISHTLIVIIIIVIIICK